LTYYSSCDDNEVAREGVLCKILEGHVPDLAGGGDFSVLRDHTDKKVGGRRVTKKDIGKVVDGQLINDGDIGKLVEK